MQRAEIHLDQHRDDHDPDQQAHRQINASDFPASDDLKHARQPLAQQNAGHDAQKHPYRQVTLKHCHGNGNWAGDRRGCRHGRTQLIARDGGQCGL